jgi:MFS family permease
MLIFRLIRAGRWPTLFGYALFIGMLAAGYTYNLTFVQFGILDLGTRLVGMSEARVVAGMAALALLTCLAAIATGLWMQRSGRSADFVFKLRLTFGIVLAQTLLTTWAPAIRSQPAFFAWIVVASLALGLGVPATFGLTVDLIPVRDRGLAAAMVTGLAYFSGAVFSTSWQIEAFSAQFLGLMAFGSLALGGLAFIPWPWIKALAEQHRHPAFGRGRYVSPRPNGQPRVQRRLLALIALMFAIFFVDSLGFLRLADTPMFFASSWQSPDLQVRLFIGLTHVVAALIAGVLYSALDERGLFLWIFGLFALVHLMYTFDLRLPGPKGQILTEPMLYAMAVSLYTVINFAIWADISTPQTISRNAALGVAFSGFTATFLSTALALQFKLAGLPLELHLRIVDSIAIILFVLTLFLSLLPGWGIGVPTPDQEKGDPSLERKEAANRRADRNA